jgi:hypothetical protein
VKNTTYTALKYFNIIFASIIVLGCSSVNRDIYISRDKSLNNYNLNVDLVGVNKFHSVVLTNDSYPQYWIDQNNRNKLHVKEFYFKQSSINTQLLSKNDPVWSFWNGDKPDTLFILSNVEEVQNINNWRSKFILDNYSWFNFWSDRSLYLIVTKKGIREIKKDNI